MGGAREVQIGSLKRALVLKELAIQCRLKKIAVLRFAGEASRFAVVRNLLHERVALLQPPQQRSRMYAENARSVSLVLPGGVKHFRDVAVFEFLQTDELIAGRRNVHGRQYFWGYRFL